MQTLQPWMLPQEDHWHSHKFPFGGGKSPIRIKKLTGMMGPTSFDLKKDPGFQCCSQTFDVPKVSLNYRLTET